MLIVLRETTTFLIGWSYFVAWTSVGFAFLSCLFYTAALFSIRNDIKVSYCIKCLDWPH